MLTTLLIGLVTLGQVRGRIIAPDPQPNSASASPASAPLAEYEGLRRAAGRDADSQVELALWCERNGMKAERDRHLSVALLTNPDHATARGLLGYARQADRWVRTASASAPAPANDPTRQEYLDRRSHLEDTADDHWKLALWCEQNSLPDEARAHFWNVTRLQPSRDAAWKRLGYKKRDGRWLTDQQVAALKADREAQEEADDVWSPRLKDLRADLRSDDPDRRELASRELAAIHLPRSVPAALKVFGTGDTSDQARLVQLLGQVDSVGASKALAWLALASDHAEVRRLATETLRRRDPREFAGDLITLIGDPIKYSVQPVGGPGSPGVLRIETTGYDLDRVYSPPTSFTTLPTDFVMRHPDTGELVGFRPTGTQVWFNARDMWPDNFSTPTSNFQNASSVDTASIASLLRRQGAGSLATALEQNARPRAIQGKSGGLTTQFANGSYQLPLMISGSFFLPNANPATRFALPYANFYSIDDIQRESVRASLAAQDQLSKDIALIDSHNEPIKARNGQIGLILNAVAGTDLPADRSSWAAWYTDLIGFRHLRNVPTRRGSVIQQVPIGYNPLPISQGSGLLPLVVARISCFAAGTPVRTDQGLRPIEQIEVGDLVLAQDQTTGALTYRPVTQRFDNPPSRTFSVKVAGEEIVCSEFHRFWKAGAGWVMARELKPGDPLRLVGGVAPVESISQGPTQPVFNLDVDTDASFFVGQAGALVHDNTVPALRSEVFDAPRAEAD